MAALVFGRCEFSKLFMLTFKIPKFENFLGVLPCHGRWPCKIFFELHHAAKQSIIHSITSTLQAAHCTFLTQSKALKKNRCFGS